MKLTLSEEQINQLVPLLLDAQRVAITQVFEVRKELEEIRDWTARELIDADERIAKLEKNDILRGPTI